jgi:hypothetical protein
LCLRLLGFLPPHQSNGNDPYHPVTGSAGLKGAKVRGSTCNGLANNAGR